MISRTTLLIFWFALSLALGAQATQRGTASASGWQCMSNLALCELHREQQALSGSMTPQRQAPE